jgi:ABC-type branched-subunit amino acid transport system ATPase component
VRYLTGRIIATGGTITTFGKYNIHTFTTSGTFQITKIISGGGFLYNII